MPKRSIKAMKDNEPFGFSLPTAGDLITPVVAASHDCIKIISLDGKLLEMSLPGRAAMEVDDFGALCGLGWDTLWPEESRDLIQTAVAKARTGERSVFEAFCPTAKGTPKWWEVTVAPVCDKDGTPVAILSSSRDISAQKQAMKSLGDSLEARESQLALVSEELARESARLTEMRRQLSHSEKVKLLGEFVGHIVHDMNNVLSVLASSFRLVRRKAGGSVPEEIFLHGEEAIDRGSGVVRQLLDFVRGGEDQPEQADIGALLASWRDMLRHLVGPGITLNLRVDADLPQTTMRVSALQSVLFNLVANARDAMPDGGTLSVGANLVQSAARGQKLRIFVEDEGVGMPPEVLARAGEPFFSTKPAGKGTGLGLASAFEFARASHGRVEIESVPGKGSTIAILLPLSTAAGDMPSTLESHLDPALLGHGGADLLLVEEDPATRALLADTVRSLGYTAILAASDSAAVGLVRAHPQIAAILTSRAAHDRLKSVLSSEPSSPPLMAWDAVPSTDESPAISLKTLSTPLLETLGRLPGKRLAPVILPMAERLLANALPEEARAALEIWIEQVRTTGALPSPALLRPLQTASRSGYMVSVTPAQGRALFTYEGISSDLVVRVGHPLEYRQFTGETDEGLGSLALAYLHCAGGLPYFDFAQGKGGEFSFERLVIPLSADGQVVTHLAGFIHIPANH